MNKIAYTTLLGVVLVVLVLVFSGTGTADDAQDFDGCGQCHPEITENFFNKSLHNTGAGMKKEYDKYAAEYHGINMDEYYEKWNCSTCHVTSCTQCHIGYNVASTFGHLETVEISISTCDLCHKKKQSATFMGDMPGHKKPGPGADIHYLMGFICTDCHTADEMHGTGILHETQLQAVSVQCVDCHSDPEKVVKGMQVTQYSNETRSHELHDDKLTCIACHTSWSLTCNGCHMDTRDGTKPASGEYYLGRNHKGKVTTFLKMEATIGNDTHRGYAEWNSHTITRDAKGCAFCHGGNETLYLVGYEGQIMGEGGELIDNETIKRVIQIGEDMDPDDDAIPGFAGISALMVLLGLVYLLRKR